MPYKTPEKARIKSRERMRRRLQNMTPEEKEARRVYFAAWWAANREEQSVKAAARHQAKREERLAQRQAQRDANPEHFKAQRAADHARHREERLQKMRERRLKNLADRRAKNAAWRTANLDKKRAADKRRKALKAGAKRSDISLAQWLEILHVFDDRCAYCPANCQDCADKTHELTQDHITPVTKGGDDSLHNIVPCCVSCNSKKHTGPPPNPVQPLLLTIAKPRKKRKAA